MSGVCCGVLVIFECLKGKRVGAATVLGFLEEPDSRTSLNVRWMEGVRW